MACLFSDLPSRLSARIIPRNAWPERLPAEAIDYAIALGEKQKLRFQYGLMEKQFRRIFETALQRRGVTGETLLQLLETRLDNVVVFRLGLANTRKRGASVGFARARPGQRQERQHFLFNVKAATRSRSRTGRIAPACPAQHGVDANRSSSRLADRGSRCLNWEGRAYPLARRDAADR